jgi:hypothetical protein
MSEGVSCFPTVSDTIMSCSDASLDGPLAIREKEEDCSIAIESKNEPSDDGLGMISTQVRDAPRLLCLTLNRAAPKTQKGHRRKSSAQNFQCSNAEPKTRSRSGCITCRKRKKKCDETKPYCEFAESRKLIRYHWLM